MADYNNRKSYNNDPLKEDEVLVPVLISDRETASTFNLDRENMETWRIHGHRITVAFIPAPIEQKASLTKIFWDEVRDYITDLIGDDNLLSYELMTEGAYDNEDNPHKYEPAPAPSPEYIHMLRDSIRHIITELRNEDPVYGIILDLICQEYERKEIVKELDLGKSQAYKKISEVHQKAKDIFYKE